MGFYSKFNDEELLESYLEIIEHGNSIPNDLKNEIENRGGIEQFQNRYIDQKKLKQEKNRVVAAIYNLLKSGADAYQIKGKVNSDILSSLEFDELVNRTIDSFYNEKFDKEINKDVILGALVGASIGGVLGGVLWLLSIIYFKIIYWQFLGVSFWISYFIIKFLTKKPKLNLIVFLFSFLSIFISLFIGLWFSNIIKH